MAFDRRQSHICHQDEWVSGWVSEWVSVTIESRSWPNFKPMFPGPTSCCFWSILVPYFLGYKAYSVIRRTLNFWTCFFQVDKLKISPKYPVLRCNLTFGLLHYLHFQSNNVFKVPNYSHVTFFKQKSHICSNKAKKASPFKLLSYCYCYHYYYCWYFICHHLSNCCMSIRQYNLKSFVEHNAHTSGG